MLFEVKFSFAKAKSFRRLIITNIFFDLKIRNVTQTNLHDISVRVLWENLGQDDLAFNDFDGKLVTFVDFEFSEIMGLKIYLQDALLVHLRPL